MHTDIKPMSFFFLSSMDQDEEMDTTPLAQPFFMIDKEKEADSGGEGKQGGEDSDSGEDGDPHVAGEEEEEDNEVSVTQKASANDGRLENREGSKTNGNHLAESEESSDEEEDQMDETSVRAMKCLPVHSTAQRQTLTS